ncbi:hypothetical protein BHE74_00030543 [Ensete ventricosum]|nr:hypothetical protein BHE74_00030543 [Ensete ventricosum]
MWPGTASDSRPEKRESRNSCRSEPEMAVRLHRYRTAASVLHRATQTRTAPPLRCFIVQLKPVHHLHCAAHHAPLRRLESEYGGGDKEVICERFNYQCPKDGER